jgi:hypothetical protein
MFLEEQGLRCIMDVVVKGDDAEMPEPRDTLASFPRPPRSTCHFGKNLFITTTTIII